MKKSNTLKFKAILMVLFIIIISSSSFTYDKFLTPGSNGPVKLVYTFKDGKSIPYSSSTSVTQTMDVNGQTVNVLVSNDMAFAAKMVGKSGENLSLQITIDSLITKMESMQGSTGGKMKDVAGKSFNMVISPLGKEIDVAEAAKVEYTLEGSQAANNVSQFFAHIFPDLPENAINIGDTWTKSDTLTTKTATTNTTQIVKSICKFESIEQLNGVECAKITSSISGTMESTVQNQGMDIYLKGPVQGTVTLYFAINNGYFVKQEVLSKMNGNVEITGAQNMTFPMVMETNSKVVAGK
jgi:hypothetical protein